jgi:hypothetical protein
MYLLTAPSPTTTCSLTACRSLPNAPFTSEHSSPTYHMVVNSMKLSTPFLLANMSARKMSSVTSMKRNSSLSLRSHSITL